jgi:superfamily II DNA or RNA helicase
MTDVHDPFAALVPGAVVRGMVFPEPIKVLVVNRLGTAIRLVGEGVESRRLYQPILSAEQASALTVAQAAPGYDGEASLFRLGVEAIRLGLAYEYDPFFSLSIARVDPLPHQLEAVYDHFLRLPRIRFLLADDPGAGKTIMAGLLIKELKIRGLARRILIVSPANLTFQWQREMRDKFREDFEVVRGEVFRANYGLNPFQDRPQVITSVSWVSRIEDARESLLRSRWDLVIVDEAHKMSATPKSKTLAYALGEALGELTDHYLLMTATPHKGDADNFGLFLRLLDADVYGDRSSLQLALDRRDAPFYLRRTKEALVSFPDPVTGVVKSLFTRRNIVTVEFEINPDELAFYDALSDYVFEQSARARGDDTPRGRAIGFTMAMLQRRFASSIYAVRRSLERMRDRRQRILDDPDRYRHEQFQKGLPANFDELEDEERQRIVDELEEVVASVDPAALRAEIAKLDRLVYQARQLEQAEVETKLAKLRTALQDQGVFGDHRTKLLVFTEHKDTLDYLAGDGRDGRPLGKLREWGMSVTQIHGGMKVGDPKRLLPGTRLSAEREFKEECQVMVATEAAGEGINLQCCWLMINYDIPWNPVRLEQRMGRIHRYDQERDCLIFNFVATSTREGRVLQKLLERLRAIEADLDPGHTGKVFNVLGDIFPANEIERMLRDMYARNLSEAPIIDRIVAEVDPERFRAITESTLESLARRSLNLSALVGRTAEAKEHRMVPEVVEDFFSEAAPLVGISAPGLGRRLPGAPARVYAPGRLPRSLVTIGERLEGAVGGLAREYKRIAFDKALTQADPTLEWVTPGHPLFECVREGVSELAADDLERGAVFFDLQRRTPSRLDVFSAAIRDGRGRTIEQRLFAVVIGMDGSTTVHPAAILHEFVPAPAGTPVTEEYPLPSADQVEQTLVQDALEPLLAEVTARRQREVEGVREHVERSLCTIIDRVSVQFAQLHDQKETGSTESGLEGRLRQTEDRLEELNRRLDTRRAELEKERALTIADVRLVGRAWVLPHPERSAPGVAPMVRDDEIERIAVAAAVAYEEARGCRVESVEAQNCGFDLRSTRPDPEDPDTLVEIRRIEVKGRAAVGDIALSDNEYRVAQRLRDDYWLYVVYDCATRPHVHPVQDPVRLGWKPVVRVEQYVAGVSAILGASGG